jgi:sec-independent protein translocase protein TatC
MLTSIGVLRSSFLRRNTKFVIVAVFLVAAIITPPDVTSQVLVAIPMLALFEVSVFLSSIIEKRKRRKLEDAGEEATNDKEEDAGKEEA